MKLEDLKACCAKSAPVVVDPKILLALFNLWEASFYVDQNRSLGTNTTGRNCNEDHAALTSALHSLRNLTL